MAIGVVVGGVVGVVVSVVVWSGVGVAGDMLLCRECHCLPINGQSFHASISFTLSYLSTVQPLCCRHRAGCETYQSLFPCPQDSTRSAFTRENSKCSIDCPSKSSSCLDTAGRGYFSFHCSSACCPLCLPVLTDMTHPRCLYGIVVHGF